MAHLSPSDIPDDREKALAWLDALQASVRQDVKQSIEADRTPENVAKEAARVESRMDEIGRGIYAKFDRHRKKKNIPQVACKMGCMYCCTNRVTCQVPEVARIADYLRRKWTPEQLAELQKRIDAHIAVTASLEGKAKFSRVQACAFLTEAGACSIHNVRPLSCRGLSSFDAGKCRASYNAPLDDSIQVPVVAPQFQASRAILKGLRQALDDLEVENDPVELIQGVNVCLNDPSAVQNWLEGGNDFAVATDSEVEEIVASRNRGIPGSFLAQGS